MNNETPDTADAELRAARDEARAALEAADAHLAKRELIPPPAELELVAMDDMTFEEIEIFEDVIGTFPNTKAEVRQVLLSVPKSKMLLVMALIAGRRINPEITIEDVKRWPLRSIDIGDRSIMPTAEEPGPFD